MDGSYVPQLVPTRRPLVFWAIGAALVTFVLLLIVIAPLAAATGHTTIAAGIYGAFGALCHQRPDRSYFVDGHKLAVCSRCTGLYFGFGFTLLLYPLIRSLRSAELPPRRWLIMAALPLAIDFSLTFFGFWENTHTTRLLTGALLGGVAVFYVMPGLIELGFRPASKPIPKVTYTLVSSEAIASAPSDYKLASQLGAVRKGASEARPRLF